jgi:hypothetical protein
MTRIMPTAPVVYPEWVTVQQAAKLAGRDEKTIYDWVSQERIASEWQGGRLMVPPKAAIRLGETTRRGRPKRTRQ